jgi:hypothetical protein
MLYAELNIQDIEAAEPKTHEWCQEQMELMEEMEANPNAMPEMIASFIQEHGLKKKSAFCRLSYWDRIVNHLIDIMHQQKNNGARLMDTLEGENDSDEFRGVMQDLNMNVGRLFFNGQVIKFKFVPCCIYLYLFILKRLYLFMLTYTCLYSFIHVLCLQSHWTLPSEKFGIPGDSVHDQAVSFVQGLTEPKHWDCQTHLAFKRKSFSSFLNTFCTF